MFTSSRPQKHVATAQSYFDEHLSHNDYYTAGEAKVGHWIGRGCLMLGLMQNGSAKRTAFQALCKNQHPSTGELLTQRQRAGRRIFFDFVCSPPKSVSIMAVTLNDRRLVETHEAAAKFALLELEQYACARIRKNGVCDDRVTGNLVSAAFTHTASRSLDPQLHTHFTLFNCTFDPVEDRWKALQTGRMFDAINYATEVYRNDYVRRIHALGYETKPGEHGFEIEGVPREIQERFSKRAKERDEAIAKMERKLGRELTNNEISHLVHQTRPRKLNDIATEEVKKLQLTELTPAELMVLQSLHRTAMDNTRNQSGSGGGEEAALQTATDHLFERKSVVSKEDLLCHALIEGRGNVNLEVLKRKLDDTSKYVRVGDEFSLRSILEKELSLIQMVNSGKHVSPSLNPQFSPAPWLGEDQRNAVLHVLQSSDQITGFRGLAGTGKSTALTEISNALRPSEYRILFCAPTTAATEVLQKDGHNAQTLQRLLVDPYVSNTLSEYSVIVLDEAGAVGLDDMHKLLSLAQEHGSRVILSGDTGQHTSVTSGDALRILEGYSRYDYGQLTHIRRQQRADYLEAVKLAAEKKPQQAFDRLDRMGEVTEWDDDLYSKAAEAYLDVWQCKQSALIVAPTWSEIEAVTVTVREKLKQKGTLLGVEHSKPVLESLGWSEAQKRMRQRYQPGQVLVFHAQSSALAKGESVVIQTVLPHSLKVQRTDGSTANIRLPRENVGFDVCKSKSIFIASGDKLLLQANDAKHGLTNGQLVEVKTIEGKNIVLTNGRIIPETYRQFTHGYAVTSHASQGKTVDEVLLVASFRSLAAVNREQFYVSISRGRHRCRIFTDDKERLRDRLQKTARRKAAIELAPLEAALSREGFAPNTAAKEKPAPASAPLKTASPLHSHAVTTKQRTFVQRIITAFKNWYTHLRFVEARNQQQQTQTPHTRRRGISVC